MIECEQRIYSAALVHFSCVITLSQDELSFTDASVATVWISDDSGFSGSWAWYKPVLLRCPDNTLTKSQTSDPYSKKEEIWKKWELFGKSQDHRRNACIDAHYHAFAWVFKHTDLNGFMASENSSRTGVSFGNIFFASSSPSHWVYIRYFVSWWGFLSLASQRLTVSGHPVTV